MIGLLPRPPSSDQLDRRPARDSVRQVSHDGGSKGDGARRPSEEGRPGRAIRAGSSRRLARAATLNAADWQCTLQAGEFLIGRDPDCWVCIDDPMASRQHARLRVADDQVLLEDARSANGVYVNGRRISAPYALSHGDRIVVGATEIVVLSATPSQRPSLPADERPTLTGVREEGNQVATVRAEALEVLGRVAERLLAAGNLDRARAVLGDQLIKILEGARAGTPVRDELCTLAARYALKLARARGEGHWIDYTLELHLRTEQCLAPGTLADLLRALQSVPAIDRAMFTGYCDWLTQAAERVGEHASRVLAQLRRAELPPDHA